MTPPVPPNNHDDDDRRDQSHRDGYSDDERDERRTDSLDARYGDLTVAAKGSIVVLVIMLGGNAVLMLMLYGWLIQKIESVVAPQNVVLESIVTTMHKHRGEQGSENRALREDIVRNRDYLREIGRECLLTDIQKTKFQANLSSAMKELLMRDYINPDK